jgi:AraC-like DNA-binding protein
MAPDGRPRRLLYLEYKPVSPLTPFLQKLWYARAPGLGHARERILPNGCVQVILNLARDFLLDCPDGEPNQKMPPALVVGARSVYELVDTSDMDDLIGIVFQPGGFPLFAGGAADAFSNRSIDLEAVWGCSAVQDLRDRLRQIPAPSTRLRCLEAFLLERCAGRLPALNMQGGSRHALVAFALAEFDRRHGAATVRSVAADTGLSERRFSQIFREQVGLSPKVWCRVQRFHRAVRQMHAGTDVRWAELSLECGFYDQSHFANEFRAFSGIDATTYSARRTLWTNHVTAE